jgi:signal transduction histidine kinase
MVSEREQRRIGQDLHDDLCQQLTGIEYLSQTLASRLASVSASDATRAREIARMVREAMDYTRELAHGLSPMRLETVGLRGTLLELARRTRKLFGIQCRFRCKKLVVIEDINLCTHLYRIAQEAVANAVKHSKARRMEISMTTSANGVVMTVQDDGVGIPRVPRAPQGLGLYTMRYRAGVIGANLVVRRGGKRGTTVCCTVRAGANLETGVA